MHNRYIYTERQSCHARTPHVLTVLPSQILIYYCVGKQSKQMFFKKVLNYQLSNASPKMSNNTCCTKLNPKILLCRRAKQARKFHIIVVLPRQILVYYCVGKQSEPKNVQIWNNTWFTKSNPIILLCRKAKQAYQAKS